MNCFPRTGSPLIPPALPLKLAPSPSAYVSLSSPIKERGSPEGPPPQCASLTPVLCCLLLRRRGRRGRGGTRWTRFCSDACSDDAFCFDVSCVTACAARTER